MSNQEENVKVVKQVYAALGKGDLPTVMQMLADDVEWDMPHPREIVPFGGKWQGKEEVKKFFATMHETVETKQVQVHEFVAENNKVVVICTMKLLAKPTQQEWENDVVAVWTLEAGKVKQMRDFMDTVQAVTAFSGE